MAKVVQIDSVKEKSASERKKKIIDILEGVLSEAKEGRILSIILNVELAGAYRSLGEWDDDQARALGMCEILRAHLIRRAIED